MEYSYVWEKFFGATMSLIGSGSQKQRLEYAAQSIVSLKNVSIPYDVQEDVLALISDLTCVRPKGDESRVVATIAKMSAQEIDFSAKRILGMLDGIARHLKPFST